MGTEVQPPSSDTARNKESPPVWLPLPCPGSPGFLCHLNGSIN